MNSHLTAIARKAFPVPVRWLFNQSVITRSWIHGAVLDYGCGKCAEINQTMRWHPDVWSITNFDPYYAPRKFKLLEKFDVILCTYVLCATPKQDELSILRHIQSLLKESGVAYITVRNDKPRQGYGISSRGTLQRKVILPLEEIRKTSQYRIYKLTKETSLIW